MFLSPSKILYTHNYDQDIFSCTEQTFNELIKTHRFGSVFPKLQVVKKDGFYFTLNDAKLQVYRHLEKLGQCGAVEVDKVSLKEVPEGIRKLMRPPEGRIRIKRNKTKYRGHYTSVLSTTCTEVKKNDTLTLTDYDDIISADESSDDETDDEDTASNSSEWSDEDYSTTDVETDNEDHEQTAMINGQQDHDDNDESIV
ncbi:uncharacterized protein LOC127866078 [Dreissena polymorpha]|uniref:Uncharacterized protein n=1 Tax=Dreissena polymorpha TaxID=45954 RepID=A0A9D4RCR0_DREPO|nr:uncharacterized protein LOC127866078 [Dreissena polymorpha]KAH3861887.1 hypothetical protein DPMN_024840 [Dreissena polymorpha]